MPASSRTGTGPRPSSRSRKAAARSRSSLVIRPRSQVRASRTYGLPSAAGGDAPAGRGDQDDEGDDVGQRIRRTRAGWRDDVAEIAGRWAQRDRDSERFRRRRTGSAAPNAPSGVQRPKMTAAERDEAAPGGHPVLERPALLEGQVRPRQSGEDPAQDDVPVAQLDDVDPDRLGGLRVLADGPRPQAPARPEEPELEEDDQEEDRRSRSGPGRRAALMIQPTSGRSTR